MRGNVVVMVGENQILHPAFRERFVIRVHLAERRSRAAVRVAGMLYRVTVAASVT